MWRKRCEKPAPRSKSTTIISPDHTRCRLVGRSRPARLGGALQDERIRRNRIEREALEAAHVRAFFLTQQDITGQEMAELFRDALLGMTKRTVSQPAPFIFTISHSGKFSRIK
ncbi:MAG: hypothetical protein M5R42_18955 [Rhodocyclaceae bacterium]|nr:hypothetical protein [Rhodocyclaceae bacterium]